VRGSYFEGCNCEAICPCRSVGGRPGGPSSFGECFGALSWHIRDGHADGTDLSGLRAVMALRYFDRVQPSTPWEVVLYVDRDADDVQRAAIADIFLGRAGGTVAQLYGPAIGDVHVVRPARTTRVPRCTAASCDRPTRHCAGRYEDGATPPSLPTLSTGPTADSAGRTSLLAPQVGPSTGMTRG
jgi:hypothetical protein